MGLKENYYKLSKEDFNVVLDFIKNEDSTITFFKNTKSPYFYYESSIINNKILELNKKQWVFDLLFNSFSKFGQNQLLQSFLIEEINSTNQIENIYSTRHDIFYILTNNKLNTNTKIESITKAYSYLLSNGATSYKTKKDIRQIYDYLFINAIDENDLPDGKYFRKNSVSVNDGLKNVHQGFLPEVVINDTMDEFLKLYNSKKETYLKNIIAHFMIETIHPYYDGNGRLGRFLFTNSLLKDTNSYFSLLIANAINSNKAKYYKAIKTGRDIHEFGCINSYVEIMLDILLVGIEKEIKNLNSYFAKINKKENIKLSKNELIVYQLLKEASILSLYGVSNNELIKYSNLSKRTIITIMNSFKEKGILKDSKIAKTTYHKLKAID